MRGLSAALSAIIIVLLLPGLVSAYNYSFNHTPSLVMDSGLESEPFNPMPYRLMLFQFISGFFVMLLAHELGHAITMSRLLDEPVAVHLLVGRDVGVRLFSGSELQVVRLSNNDLLSVLRNGVFYGLLPLVVFLGVPIVFFSLLAVYFVGVRGDVMRTRELITKNY